MSLKWYLRPRLVALDAGAPVLEGARALESNNIGVIMVQERGRVAGIVTDRDLAVRVVGQGLDPTSTTLGEVMTTPVVTLSPADSQLDAIRFMRQRNIRRIPLVDGDRLVGLVSLDDLLLDEAAPLEQLAAIVESQLGEGGPAGSPRSPGRVRSAARAEATLGRLVNRVRADAGLESSEQAAAALETVLAALVRRLTPDEAEDLISQLPSLLQPILRGQPLGPDKQVTRETIESELGERLELDASRAAPILEAVGGVIADTVSSGQMEDVRRQLPEAMRGIFAERAVAAET
jgi:CBS domain-containing protein/uncharacterized protein (DUF2267 family)